MNKQEKTMSELIVELDELENKATQAPWFVRPEETITRENGSSFIMDMELCYGSEGDRKETYHLYESYQESDYRLIADLRNAWPRISAELKRLSAQLHLTNIDAFKLEAQLGDIENRYTEAAQEFAKERDELKQRYDNLNRKCRTHSQMIAAVSELQTGCNRYKREADLLREALVSIQRNEREAFRDYTIAEDALVQANIIRRGGE